MSAAGRQCDAPAPAAGRHNPLPRPGPPRRTSDALCRLEEGDRLHSERACEAYERREREVRAALVPLSVAQFNTHAVSEIGLGEAAPFAKLGHTQADVREDGGFVEARHVAIVGRRPLSIYDVALSYLWRRREQWSRPCHARRGPWRRPIIGIRALDDSNSAVFAVQRSESSFRKCEVFVGKKLVRALADLRFPKSETKESHHTRREVASHVLRWLKEHDPKGKLWQLKGLRIGSRCQIPDFTVELTDGRKQAIEIGLVGNERVDSLARVCDDVLRVRRGGSFRYRGLPMRKRRVVAAAAKSPKGATRKPAKVPTRKPAKKVARKPASAMAPRCREYTHAERRCRNRAEAGNYGFCGVHR